MDGLDDRTSADSRSRALIRAPSRALSLPMAERESFFSPPGLRPRRGPRSLLFAPILS